MAITEAEIQAVIDETKGWEIYAKLNHFNLKLAPYWVRRGYDQNKFDAFSDATMNILRLLTWNESPPIWYHGGPSGIEVGELLLPFPLVPNNSRKTLAEFVEARQRLAFNPRAISYVYFTDFRELALGYSQGCKDGRIYRVQPEGKIQIDPNNFAMFVIARQDSEIKLDNGGLLELIINWSPGFRAPSARILGPG